MIPVPSRRRPRVSSACDRCKKHKLRCDRDRPCSLCIRSEVPCTSNIRSTTRGGRGRRSRILSATGPLATPSATTNSTLTAIQEPNNVSQSAPHQHRQSTQKDGVQLEKCVFGTSSVDWTTQILKEFNCPDTVYKEAPALPGGTREDDDSSIENESPLISPLVNLNLPSKAVTDAWVNTYFKSVHWFMVVVHEPNFRQLYEAVSSQQKRVSQGRLILTLLVLAIGANYASQDIAQDSHERARFQQLSSMLIEKVQSQFWEVTEEGGLETVQISILLSSYYLYNGRPNLGFVILGTGVRCAQAMRLHREALWPTMSQVGLEERKRVWWALYTYDRFASIVFGRPCTIRDQDSSVSMPLNMDDIAQFHPHLSTLESLDDGSTSCVNIYSYQRYKFRLYQLSSPIITDLHAQDMTDISAITTKIQRIQQRLLDWQSTLPRELQLALSYKSWDQTPNDITKTFFLQSLVLQLAYENVTILLNRPLLSWDLGSATQEGHSPSPPNNTLPDKDLSLSTQRMIATSKARCWESALRVSKLITHRSRLQLMSSMYAAPYMGMHLFTAGMVLSIFALSNPLGAQTPEVKHALGRIIRMTSLLDHRTPLLAQSSKILEDLLRLILSKEMEAIIGHDEVEDSSSSHDAFPFSDAELPSLRQHQQTASAPTAHTYQLELFGTQSQGHDDSGLYCSLANNGGGPAASLNFQPEIQPGWDDINLDIGVRSVQQVMQQHLGDDDPYIPLHDLSIPPLWLDEQCVPLSTSEPSFNWEF